MASPTATPFPARGKVTEKRDGGGVVFAAAGTNYELHLAAPAYDGPLDRAITGTVRVTARKIWTVPPGGNFISPVIGQPRTIQGRIVAIDERSIVVQAGLPIVIEFPAADSAFDLANGPLTVGHFVNVMVMPGPRFERV